MQMKPGVADDMQARLNALTAKLPANTMNLLAQSTAALASGGGASAPPTAQLTTTASPATATAAAAPAAATATAVPAVAPPAAAAVAPPTAAAVPAPAAAAVPAPMAAVVPAPVAAAMPAPAAAAVAAAPLTPGSLDGNASLRVSAKVTNAEKLRQLKESVARLEKAKQDGPAVPNAAATAVPQQATGHEPGRDELAVHYMATELAKNHLSHQLSETYALPLSWVPLGCCGGRWGC